MPMKREGIGRNGEPYAWSRILVFIWKDGRLASLVDFDADDEDAAVVFSVSVESGEDQRGGGMDWEWVNTPSGSQVTLMPSSRIRLSP